MTETTAWREHPLITGEIDFTMMYAAHDAFTRELRRLASACNQGNAATPETREQWATFRKHLHIHHTAEDTSLWPRLRTAVDAPHEVAVLDAMQDEHTRIDPQLERVNAAIAAGDATVLVDALHALTADLTAHMHTRKVKRCHWTKPISAALGGPPSAETSDVHTAASGAPRTTCRGYSTTPPTAPAPKCSGCCPRQPGSSTGGDGHRDTAAAGEPIVLQVAKGRYSPRNDADSGVARPGDHPKACGRSV